MLHQISLTLINHKMSNNNNNEVASLCQFVKSTRTKLELLENLTEAKIFMARDKTEWLSSEGLDKETLKESELKIQKHQNCNCGGVPGVIKG